MPTSTHLDIEQFKTQAKNLVKQLHLSDITAVARVNQFQPNGTPSPTSLKLADAQWVIARENGFPSWPKFQRFVLFRNAVEALDTGDVATLDELLTKHKFLLTYQCHVGEWYTEGYFAGANLLNHIAGNPIRVPLPANIVEVTRLLLKHGAKDEVSDPRRTIGLLLSSRQASEAAIALKLIDLIAEQNSVVIDFQSPDILELPLENDSLQTAEELVKRGADMDIHHAAGLGRLDRVIELAPTVDAHNLELALNWACKHDQTEVLKYLLSLGVDIHGGCKSGQGGLHLAAHTGKLSTVKLLLGYQVDLEVKNVYGGTPLGQAIWSAINEPQPDHLAIIEALIKAGAKIDPNWYQISHSGINELLEKLIPSKKGATENDQSGARAHLCL